MKKIYSQYFLIAFSLLSHIANAQNSGSFVLESGTVSNRTSSGGGYTNTYFNMTSNKFNSNTFFEGHLRNTVSGSRGDMNYRLLSPPGYDLPINANKKYPIIIMMHGAGESGISWPGSGRADYLPTDDRYLNNDHSLTHGGKEHLAAITLSGTNPSDPRAFNGFYLVAQNSNGWYDSAIETLLNIIELTLIEKRIDKDRVYVHGLSNGGQGSWTIVGKRPDLFAAYLPMSAVNPDYNLIPKQITVPMWQFQGGQDGAPKPGIAQNGIDELKSRGGNPRYTLYPSLGHGTWETAYNEPDFFTWILSKTKKYVHVYYGRTTFCTDNFAAVKIAVSEGFGYYQWYKNGSPISGANASSLQVTTFGDYNVVFKRNKIEYLPLRTVSLDPESITSDIVSFTLALPSPKPTITFNSTYSFPGLDGNTSVTLIAPSNKSIYQWYKDNVLISGANGSTFTTSAIGNYTLSVTDLNQCASPVSDVVAVNTGNPNGSGSPAAKANTPAAPTNPAATNININSINFSWSDNATNELGYEIYRSATSGGPYSILAILPSGTASYNDINLMPNKVYYYRIRAFNNSGASLYTNEIKAGTLPDVESPSTPTLSLDATKTTPTSISVNWTTATDNVGIENYVIYYSTGGNAISSLSVGGNQTTGTITGLTANQYYNVTIKAFDKAGNSSVVSNQISEMTIQKGLDYSFYEGGTWDYVADFDNWPSTKTGRIANFNINTTAESPAGIRPITREDYFAYNFTGYIYIVNAGTYTFGLNSDDGSLLYIDGVKIVDYDGKHGAEGIVTGLGKNSAPNPISLSAGPHLIKVRFFERSGGNSLSVTYKGSDTGNNMVVIPDAKLVSSLSTPPMASLPPLLAAPTSGLLNGLVTVNLGWTNNTTNTAIEIFRSQGAGTYSKIATTAVNGILYKDTTVAANTQYSYKLIAINANGQSGFSNIVTITTGNSAGALVSPTSLAASIQGVGIKLIWVDNSNNESGFEVERASLAVGGPFYKIATTSFNTTQYLDNSVLSGQNYYYRVRAVNTGNQSGYSNTATATPATVPAIPTELTTRILHSTGVELKWKDNADNENGFRIERSTTPASGYIVVADSIRIDSLFTTTGKYGTFRDESVVAGTNYYYRIKAFKSPGASEFTSDVSVEMPESMVFVNFKASNSALGGPLPPNFNYYWNNSNGDENVTLINAKTDKNTNSAISVTTTSSFAYSGTNGYNSGNNTGIFPDEITSGFNYIYNSSPVTLQISGLSTSKVYSFTFYSSIFPQYDNDALTQFKVVQNGNVTVNGLDVVQLNGYRNVANTVTISGVSSTSGVVDLEIKKLSTNNAPINALIISCYDLPSKIFYANSTTNINSLSAWGENANGSGASPVSFSAGKQIFKFQPNTTTTLTNNFSVSGTNSKIVIDTLVKLIVPSSFTLSANVEVKNGGHLVFENENITTVLLSVGKYSTLEYNMTNAYSLPTIAAGFGDLKLAGAGAKTLPSTLIVNGDFTINSPITTGPNSIIDFKKSLIFSSTPVMPTEANSISLRASGSATQNIQTNGETVYINNLEVAENATLIQAAPEGVNVGAGTLNIFGNLTNLGTFQGGVGTLLMSGTGLQTMKGNLNCYNVTIGNGSANGVVVENSIVSKLTIKNTFKMLASSKFNTNDRMVLSSDQNGTGRIAKVESGALFSGKITMQRFVGDKAAGFYLFGTSLKNQKILDWNDNFKIQGISDAWPGAASTSKWNTTTKLWNVITTNEDVLPGKGIRAYLYASQLNNGSVLIDNFGEPIIGDGSGVVGGDFIIPLTYSANANWNLIANPYPCEIDFNNSGWDLTHIDSSFYVWDGKSKNYRAYVMPNKGHNIIGTGTLGGDSKIASGQAFMVVSKSAGSIKLNENVKTENFPAFYRKAKSENQLNIELSGGIEDSKDEIIIRLHPSASKGFESGMDVKKLDGPYLNLSSMADDQNLTINTTKITNSNEVVKLNVQSVANSNCSFKFNNIDSFDSTSVYLIDSYLHKKIKLVEDANYEFAINDKEESKGNKRFAIEFISATENNVSSANIQFYQNKPNPFSHGTTLYYSSKNEGVSTILIYNSLGSLVDKVELQSQSGLNEFYWDSEARGISISNGIYNAFLTQLGEKASIKLIMQK